MPNENQLPTFDVVARAQLSATAQNVIAEHPEIRSIITVIDYRGPFATAGLPKMIWVTDSPGKTVIAPDSIIGSLQAVLQAAGFIMTRAEAVEVMLRQGLAEAGTALLQKVTNEQPPASDAATTSQSAKAKETTETATDVQSGNPVLRRVVTALDNVEKSGDYRFSNALRDLLYKYNC